MPAGTTHQEVVVAIAAEAVVAVFTPQRVLAKGHRATCLARRKDSGGKLRNRQAGDPAPLMRRGRTPVKGIPRYSTKSSAVMT